MYARTVGGQDLTFQVSGMLWQRSLVMRDLETKTLWSHLLGRGMEGKLLGVELERFPASMTTWIDWKERHPDTTLLAMTRTSQRYLDRAWQNPERFVFGMALGPGTVSPAVELKKLQEDSLVEIKRDGGTLIVTHSGIGGSIQAFETRLAGRELSFSKADPGKMKDRETGTTWNMVTGTGLSGELKDQRLVEIPGTVSFREAWENFYPESKPVR